MLQMVNCNHFIKLKVRQQRAEDGDEVAEEEKEVARMLAEEVEGDKAEKKQLFKMHHPSVPDINCLCLF